MSSQPRYLASSYRQIFGEPLRLPAASSRPGSASLSGPSLPRRHGLPLGAPRRAEAWGDLGQASAPGREYRLGRGGEQEQLQGLNDRFAGYLERVRQLEQQNRLLEAELGALRQRRAEPSRLGELFRGELRQLRAQLEEAGAEQAEAAREREQLAGEVQRLRARCEEEARGRAEAEQRARAQQQEVDGAARARLGLEKKVEALREELAFLRQVHEEELAELAAALQAAQVAVEPDLATPDLSSALREIRGQYESLAAKNLQAAEEWYRSKFANLNEQAARSSQAVRASREEIQEYRRQLQARTVEVESLRGANESLERQIQEMEERHGAEVGGLQDSISQLENDLRNTKSEMAHHLREYQDLLNVKMALDIEIAAYRKLLEGEETRFTPGSISISALNPHSNPSYSFQPRVFSLPVATASKISPTRSFKKEEKEEASKVSSKVSSSQMRETFAEMIEETVTKKTEQSNPEEGNITNQKI
ncbi:alpha-internexin [Trachemys scripta elegans]|uniref:alpha-internexin n=1 Tax=Trachemys scripta elegans TaxID=31138 RepID=UPI0015540FD8|nr:alpha-internexin [Trachemys scripta elegans]